MQIYLYKNKEGFITGFQSHIKKPHLWNKRNLRTIGESDYMVLLYFLTGRKHIKETTKVGTGVKRISNLNLRDDGDFISKYLKRTKAIIN